MPAYGIIGKIRSLVYIKPMHKLFIVHGYKILLFIIGISLIILLSKGWAEMCDEVGIGQCMGTRSLLVFAHTLSKWVA